ncbi:hypothetical protein FRACA_210012 [Frankia canadensis]|uniref:Uncharacterized protein n=1 Tax=Frankia canadensis TaxID=1836972 RepID=A0A2I2KQI3_9ACTN|nr:hypothetical protein FRACA_210012 [Frankia canadensis]SOU55217.1 hypothetical protein FRACA_210012 [Frankia canadensis]
MAPTGGTSSGRPVPALQDPALASAAAEPRRPPLPELPFAVVAVVGVLAAAGPPGVSLVGT